MFSYKFYNSILENLKESEYEIISFETKEEIKERKILLRHDVDIDIWGAIELGKIENMNGFKSIFFFQPNAEIYNMLSTECEKIIHDLHTMGHDVGLHIDASKFQTASELNDYIYSCFNYYSLYFPLKRIISFHRPAPFILDGNIQIKEFINVYDEKFTKRIKYCSDSNHRRFWLQKEYLDSINMGHPIQLLTHPIWWGNSKRDLEIYEVYERYSNKLNMYKDRALSRNIGVFNKLIMGRNK